MTPSRRYIIQILHSVQSILGWCAFASGRHTHVFVTSFRRCGFFAALTRNGRTKLTSFISDIILKISHIASDAIHDLCGTINYLRILIRGLSIPKHLSRSPRIPVFHSTFNSRTSALPSNARFLSQSR